MTVLCIQETRGFAGTKRMPNVAPDNRGSRGREEMLPEQGFVKPSLFTEGGSLSPHRSTLGEVKRDASVPVWTF